MSFKAFIWAWQQDVENATDQHILLALANIAPLREVRASATYIANQTRRSERHVRRSIERLAEIGLITVTPRPGRTDVIRLEIPASFVVSMAEEEADMEAGIRGRPRRKTPDISVENPGQNERKPPPLVSDEPIEEPKKEPKRANALVVEADDVKGAYDAYRLLAQQLGAALPTTLNDARKRQIRARLKEVGGALGWQAALTRVAASPYLCGSTHHRFAITLDFLLQPSSFTKLMEGFYDPRPTHGEPTDGYRRDPTIDRAQQRAAAIFEPMAAGAQAALDRRRGRWGSL